MRPTDDQDVRSVHGERTSFFLLSFLKIAARGLNTTTPTGCYGVGYPLSAIDYRGGTVDACPDDANVDASAYTNSYALTAHSYTYTLLIHPNVDARVSALRLCRGASINASIPLAHPVPSNGRAVDAVEPACPTPVGRLQYNVVRARRILPSLPFSLLLY